MKDLYWICPNCNEKVDFGNQLEYVFSEDDGEADFCPKHGLFFHTIFCEKCDSSWTISISGMCKPEIIEG